MLVIIRCPRGWPEIRFPGPVFRPRLDPWRSTEGRAAPSNRWIARTDRDDRSPQILPPSRVKYPDPAPSVEPGWSATDPGSTRRTRPKSDADQRATPGHDRRREEGVPLGGAAQQPVNPTRA